MAVIIFNKTLTPHQRKLHADTIPQAIFASPMVPFADKIQTLHLQPFNPYQIGPVLSLPQSQCYKLLEYLCSCLEPSFHLWRNVKFSINLDSSGETKKEADTVSHISSFCLISGATSSHLLLGPFSYLQSVNCQYHDLGC